MADLTISIIIITSNRPFLLKHCLERVLAQPYPHKEIIVVDSSSNDESEQVVAQYPEVISVRLHGQRNNMPRARNEGIAVSSGDILAFIDDDSMVQPGWLATLVNAYLDETVGAVGGRVIDMPEPYCNQVSGTPRLVVLPWGRVIRKGTGLFSTAQVEVDHLPGGNMSFRHEALEQVGCFDPNYTLTNLREETDICVRVKKAGWHVVFVPTMAVTHFSLRPILDPFFRDRPVYQFSNGRNSMYFAVKHFGLHPRTLFSELVDASKPWVRIMHLPILLLISAVAQMVGRVVGLGAGITLLMSSQRRAAAAPKIGRGEQVGAEQVSLPVASQSESLT
jgi:glycosyltransferase involved in cell wall biosynthesis